MTRREADFRTWMHAALIEARAAGERGEIPIGAVVVDSTGRLLAAAGNRREADHDPTAHAEVLALRKAAQEHGDWRLIGCTLVVTVEPCPMCAGLRSCPESRRWFSERGTTTTEPRDHAGTWSEIDA